jgi:DNA-binding CsgD family transcriptional regulator
MADGDAFAGRAGLRGSFGRFMYVNGADDLLRLGRWDEVQERLDEAERLEPGMTSEPMLRAIGTQLKALRGETGEAHDQLERGLAVAGGLPSEFVTPLHTAGAVLALVEGDPAAARDHVRAGRDGVDVPDPLYTPPLLTAGLAAEAELAGLARARHRPAEAAAAIRRAGRLVEQLDAIAAAHGGTSAPPDALANRALGHAELARARGDPSPERWDEAAERFDALHEPFPAAQARLRLAEAVLAATGARSTAARLLGLVARTARDLRAAPLEAQAAALARRARVELPGEEPGPADAAGAPAGLTSREAEIVALLAAGLTNREIGRRLFITPKTVGTHVAHIFDKLDVHTRMEAAARAEQLGVVPPVR